MTKLTSIALTASGSNKHADVTFFKSQAKPDDEVEKKAFLTSVTDGHSHSLVVTESTVIFGGSTDWVDGHFHPLIIKEDGSIEIGTVDDHTHTVEGDASMFLKASHPDKKDKKKNKSIRKEDTVMPKDTDANKDQAAEIKKLQADLKKATSLSTMTDTQKSFYETLDETNQPLFLEKASDKRDEEIALAKVEDGVIFKSSDGTEYRKSDDPRLIALAKRSDQQAKTQDDARKELIKEKALRDEMVYTKRAEDELANLPGNVETHVSLLKAIDLIENKDQREAALATMKAQNSALAPAFTTVGTEEVSKAADDAEGELERLTQEYVKKNPETEYFEAYDIISKANPQILAKSMA